MSCKDLRREMERICDRSPDSEECREARRKYSWCQSMERASWVLSRISASIAAKEAMEFIDCMRRGGTFEECHGYYKASPFPSPGCPIFRELLNKLPKKERLQALQFLKRAFLERIKDIDKELRIKK